MEALKRFMAYHHDPDLDFNVVQANWRKCAQVETASWVRTYYNEKEGMRYCVWLAPDEEELKNVFKEIGLTYESILPVEETLPDMWGERWEEHLIQEETADTLGF